MDLTEEQLMRRRASQKKYRDANKEKLKEYYKQYKQRNGKCDVCNKEMKQASILRHKRAAH